jgi:putative membrane-bound dehydrogenase-like protein
MQGKNLLPPPLPAVRRLLCCGAAVGLLVLACLALRSPLLGEPVPHGQDQMPGPALLPRQAVERMKVPPGFSVEVVASEPDIVNPVAMTFDERGRVWITESLEYPRFSAGPGRDRIKVLEDTDGDGKMDKFTIFAEGLNIPSGIAVGGGGVWVANAPDILFYKIGPDGKAGGKPEVVVTGFGRNDTHELPNSLTWGPDGWLYGFNGVFNDSHVKHRGKDYWFTCALFRIHPRTREFQLFCEGTSNPWGIAFDTEGSAFVSACVIDHLWHLTESGYYHRQGGPYPPFTWKLDSIVRHHHQKAAYCGLHFFDSDAYPLEYREKLYMGNIHGNCINVDVIERDGATYFARPAPDFLTANDAWFMPVSQKTGPDGCLYLLDWYDRYHCYQDARRDPEGIDRQRGRLYRVRYKDTPRAKPFDLSRESDEQLIGRLHSPNIYFRDLAQRLLRERNNPATCEKLQKLVLDEKEPRKARIHALWSLVGAGPLEPAFHERLLSHQDASYRAWAVRAAGNQGKVSERLRDQVAALAHDSSPDVQLQVAIAARKIDGVDALNVLVDVLAAGGKDKLIPHIVWQNLHPLLEDRADDYLQRLVVHHQRKGHNANILNLMPLVAERILGRRHFDPALVSTLLSLLTIGPLGENPQAARQCMAILTGRVQNGEIREEALKSLSDKLLPMLRQALRGKRESLYFPEGNVLAATLGDPYWLTWARRAFAAAEEKESVRQILLAALIYRKDAGVLRDVPGILADARGSSPAFRGQVLAALGKLDDPQVAPIVLKSYARLGPELRLRAIELLTQRTSWGKQLVEAIGRKEVPAEALGVNQVRKLLASKNAELVKAVRQQWGTIREGRNPQRERMVEDMKKLLRGSKGDPKRGRVVFSNLCGQCHKIHGEGQDVGPDITSNGRASFEQLVSNVFDPSLVIGAAYQATTVETTKGRVLTGLLVEDNARRVVLKMQGGKLETVPRDDIDSVTVSAVSLMPEGIENQLKRDEIIDLFAFLTLDRPPEDPRARPIPGTLGK